MWTANLFQVATGSIGPQINYETLSWSTELNGIESIQLTLRKSDLPNLDLHYWLEPWWAGVLLCWNGRPVVAGPIITRPNETMDVVSVNCGGIRSILAARTVVREQSNWIFLNKSEIFEHGLSLGTIAKRAVWFSVNKLGGPLPITYPMADETAADDANHQRTYEGFNVQNLVTDDVLTKLSNVLNGPDIMFKPKLVTPNKLTFEMYYGTEDNPRIKQKYTPVWDTVPERGQVSDMSVIYTGSYQASRVFSLGAGADQGTLITVDTNESPLQRGFPLLERVINVGSSDKEAIVRAHGQSHLDANKDALLEIQMTVRGDGELGFGHIWPGDLAHVYMKGWISLPDGLTKMRILSLTGDGTPNVRVSLQKEDKFL